MKKALSVLFWHSDDPNPPSDRLARTLYYLVGSLFVINSVFFTSLLIARSDLLPKIPTAWFFLVVTLISAILFRINKVKTGGILLVSILWILQVISIYPQGVFSPSFHFFFIIFFIAGLIFGVKSMIILLAVTIVIIFIMVFGQINGVFPQIVLPGPGLVFENIFHIMVLTINTLLSTFAIRYLNQEQKRANDELAELILAHRDLDANRQILMEKDRLIEGITNNLPGIVFQAKVQKDSGTMLTYIGHQSKKILGLPPIPAGFFEKFQSRLHPDDQVPFQDSITANFEHQKDWFFQGRFFTTDNQMIWIRGIASPDPVDSSIYNGILMDITSTKQLEEQVKYEQEQISAFINNESIAIVIADKDGQIVQTNTPYARLMEMDIKEILHKKIWDLTQNFIEPQNRTAALIERIKQTFFHALETGQFEFSQDNVFSATTPSGRKMVLQQNMFLFQTSQGPCLGSFLVDLTELEKSKIAQQDSEKSYRALFEQGPFEISVSRMNGELLDVNDRYCQETGLLRNEIIGKKAKELGRLSDEVEAELRELIIDTGGIVNQFEMTMNCNNRERVVLLSAKIIDLNNEPAIFTIITDITDRKKAERKVKQQLQQITGLRTIDSSIISGSDIEETLSLILDQTLSTINASTSRLVLQLSRGNLKAHTIQRGNELEDIEKLEWGNPILQQTISSRNATMFQEDVFVKFPKVWQEFFNKNGIHNYCVIPVLQGEVIFGRMEVFFKNDIRDKEEDWALFVETLAGQAEVAITNFKLIDGLKEKNEELLEAYESTIKGWAHALEIRDEETFGHSERVLKLSLKIARILGFSEVELSNFQRGVLLHDIGKIGIPDSILLKPGPLDKYEWVIMKKHPIFAYDLLKGISFLQHALDVPYAHHERWDGSGYPRGLKGEEIPISARIFAVVDVWDALTSDRPYRKAWSVEKTINYLKANAGTQFDPVIVETFLKTIADDECLFDKKFQ